MTPTWGMSQRLPRRIGELRAKQVMFSGRAVTGREAVAIGLANECVPDAELETHTLALAREIAANSWFTLRTEKTLLRGGAGTAARAGARLRAREQPRRGTGHGRTAEVVRRKKRIEREETSMQVAPVTGLGDEINEIRLRDGGDRHQGDHPERERAAVRPRRRSARSCTAGIQAKVKQAGPLGAAPAGGVRRHGHRLPEARLHERDHGVEPVLVLALRLSGAELRQPDDPGEVRHPRAEEEVARAAGARRDRVVLLDDRAGRTRLRSLRDPDPRRARRRRLGDQRPQVVHLERPAARPSRSSCAAPRRTTTTAACATG